MVNRLADAVSPYLRQHADNPVDWHPWGAAAFAEARRRDVPVMVSVGYATCHWCHVMARESFSDPEIGAQLARGFVAVKVDREEHPDVDASLLAAASAFTPDLGWPLTVFTTPDGAPFYAGTYWPPVPVAGRPAFRDVLDAVAQAWEQRRDQVVDTGEAIRAALRDAAAGRRTGVPRAAATTVVTPGEPGAPDATDDGPVGRLTDHARTVVDRLEAAEDRVHGGFGGAPKFPVAPTLELLLDLAASSVVDPEVARRALVLAGRTVDAMAASPLRDVDGGFFRYATRPDWSEPHYERMLYDNAQLLSAATTLAVLRRTGPVDGPLRTPAPAPGIPDPGEGAARVAADVGRFLLRVLRLADGAFASAQDSESVVDGERVEGGYYLLPPAERAHHEPPPLDTKVLTGWNGLAIEALARAGHHLGLPDLTDAARAAADRLLTTHVRADGTLVRASEGGVASDAVATLEDHGALATALLVLGGLTGETRYVREGLRLVDATVGADGELRPPQGTDPVLTDLGLAAGAAADASEGAVPSGTTAAARAALLAHLATGEPRYRDAARAHVAASPTASEHPLGAAGVLRVAVGLAEPPHQLVLVADPDLREAFREAARDWYHPDGLLLGATPGDAAALAVDGVGLLAGRGPGAYLCADFVCRLPARDPEALRAQLDA
ncbi:thioredoxin domain-containing protein [Cellulosimicrobium cellulans]|uniref:thioredoxin domain-containing protein n=1 Tax=Cellulosimicrobium cellulans TaxID=1710 RepID=UPI0030199D0E